MPRVYRIPGTPRYHKAIAELRVEIVYCTTYVLLSEPNGWRSYHRNPHTTSIQILDRRGGTVTTRYEMRWHYH